MESLLTLIVGDSVEESVKEDVEWFRANPLVRDKIKKGCRGYVLDSQTGKVQRVNTE